MIAFNKYKFAIIFGLLGVIVVSIIIAMNRPVLVKTGERMTCGNCYKVFKDDVKEIKVPSKDSNKYDILLSSGLCDSCANEILKVETGEIIRCEECGNVLRKNVKIVKVKRKDAGQYSVSEVRKGFCDVPSQKLVGDWVDKHGSVWPIRKSGEGFVEYNDVSQSEAVVTVTYQGKDGRGWLYYKGRTVGDNLPAKFYMNPCGGALEHNVLYPGQSEWECFEFTKAK